MIMNKYSKTLTSIITSLIFTVFTTQYVLADESASYFEQVSSPTPDIPLVVDPTIEIDNFFNETDLTINLNLNYDPNVDFALHVANGVALSVDLESISQDLLGVQSITLHPNTFKGAATLITDLSGSNLVGVYASGVSQIIANNSAYRKLCAFTHRMGGIAVAGSVSVTLENGNLIEVGAEVGTSMIGFTPISSDVADTDGDGKDAKATAGRLVISWPDKYCRDMKKNEGVCLSKRCGMTLGDMLAFADLSALVVPPGIIAAGVDAIADWLYQEGGFTVSGRCGEVELLWFYPLGCQCVYATF
jgi:hypothetical protein